MSMPLVFVGSAVVKPWTGSFKPGETTLDALISC
jgi:hypothetical protein